MYNMVDINDIDKYENIIIIDIRDKYEYLIYHIKNSINIKYNYLYVQPENYLVFNKKYYLYCDNGSKSRKLCIYLNKLGYNTIDLVGGLNAYERIKK